MPDRRTLHIVVPQYPLTAFLFEELQGLEDVRIVPYTVPARRSLSGLRRGIEVYLLPWLRVSRYLDPALIARLRAIDPQDTVLFFAIENRKDLQIMRKFIAARDQAVWLWNPIRNYRQSAASRLFYRWWLHASCMRVYTFDPGDAHENGIELAHQVYRHVQPLAAPEGGVAPPRQDVYFAGIDKGRLATLDALREAMEAAGLRTHFHVIPDKRRPYTAEQRARLSDRWLSYEENLRNVAQSRAIVELLQSTQRGPTIRSMEAAFLGRKLISDNLALLDSPFYHPSRMLILGHDDLARVREFIDTPLQPLDPEALRPHDIAHWIRQFQS